jgi:hypothetical protein
MGFVFRAEKALDREHGRNEQFFLRPLKNDRPSHSLTTELSDAINYLKYIWDGWKGCGMA